MQITIDSREQKFGKKAEEYYKKQGYTVTITKLEVGDYIFNDKVVFERKTIIDFMNSINDNSVFQECSNQSKYPFHYCIIHGDLIKEIKQLYYYTRNNNPKYLNNYKLYEYIKKQTNKFYGAIRRLRTFTNVIIVQDETSAIKEMALQAEKCLDPTQSFAGVVRKAAIPKANPCWLFLTCIPGISAKKANDIVETLEITSLHDLLNITAEDLVKVKGIGEKNAKKIVTFIYE